MSLDYESHFRDKNIRKLMSEAGKIPKHCSKILEYNGNGVGLNSDDECLCKVVAR